MGAQSWLNRLPETRCHGPRTRCETQTTSDSVMRSAALGGGQHSARPASFTTLGEILQMSVSCSMQQCHTVDCFPDC